MSLTTDPNDPDLGHGGDTTPVPQNKKYLVLSADEIAKGFVRPIRDTYVHVGDHPKYPLRELTEEEAARHGAGYTKYEAYPQPNPDGSSSIGRAWRQEDIDRKVCGGVTKMGYELSATYARDPYFYGATYCVSCRMHRPVREFVWDGTEDRVGS